MYEDSIGKLFYFLNGEAQDNEEFYCDGISRKGTLWKKSQNYNERPRRKCTQGSSSSHQKTVLASSSDIRKELSDGLFDQCLGNIWKETPKVRRNLFTCINSLWFYNYTVEQERAKTLTWIKKENIFSKCYVFIPIVYQKHWSLLILCHFGESLGWKTTSPFMLYLDSLHTYGALKNLESLIRSFVWDAFQIEARPESKDFVERIPLYNPKVPQQRNDKECGVYVLYYINLFLKDAHRSFSIFKGCPLFLNENWFTEEEVELFYDKLESHLGQIQKFVPGTKCIRNRKAKIYKNLWCK